MEGEWVSGRAPELFVLHVAQADLEDLMARLTATRWPAQVPSGWAMGVDPVYLRALIEHWQTTFDWREQERVINDPPAVRRGRERRLGSLRAHERSRA